VQASPAAARVWANSTTTATTAAIIGWHWRTSLRSWVVNPAARMFSRVEPA
jgi:hypothetical protein